MTASTQPQAITLPPLGPGPVHQDESIWLPQLFAQAVASGSALIKDRTFTRCRLEGPAVLLAAGGVRFDACDMGYTGGDVRNLLLRPVGAEKVIGAVAFENCTFRECAFFAVGFTGNEAFIENFLQVVGDARP